MGSEAQRARGPEVVAGRQRSSTTLEPFVSGAAAVSTLVVRCTCLRWRRGDLVLHGIRMAARTRRAPVCHLACPERALPSGRRAFIQSNGETTNSDRAP